MTNMSIRVYRLLLKTQRRCFEADFEMIKAARLKTRSEFELYRTETNPEVIEKTIAYGKQVASILDQNIAQARIVDKGLYKLQVRPSTEINDNDTIRKGRTKNKQVKPCSES